MPTPTGRPTRIFALALCGHGLLALLYVLGTAAGTDAAATGFPLDDAWIHMVYGRSFAEHAQPLYAGVPEAGCTSPLWMFVLALAHWCAALLPGSPVFYAKLFGVVAAAATTAAIHDLAARLTGHRGIAALAACLCALLPTLAFAQVSGMEVPVATATMALAIQSLAAARYRRAGIWLGLAFWARPECILLAAVATIVPIATATMTPRDRGRAVFALLWPTAVAGIVFAAWCLHVTGHPLPNTFYVKFDLTQDNPLWPSYVELLGSVETNWLGAGIALAFCGLLRVHRTGNPPLAAVAIGFPFVFVFAVVRTRAVPVHAGDWFFFARYPAPVWPLLLLGTALGVHAALQFARSTQRDNVRWLVRAAAAAALVLGVVRLPAGLLRSVEQYSWNCQNMNEVQVAFGHWTAANVPADRAVAINDAGAIAYFGDRRAIDLVGLNDHSTLFTPPTFAQVCRDADATADWLLARGVDSLVVFRSWYPDLCRHPRFSARFQTAQAFESRHYTVADPRSGQAAMTAFRVLPREPAQPR